MRTPTFPVNPVLQSIAPFLQGANSNAFVLGCANADRKRPYAQLAYLVLTPCINKGLVPIKFVKAEKNPTKNNKRAISALLKKAN